MKRLNVSRKSKKRRIILWAGMPTIGYIVYYLHLVSVLMLFLYKSHTKFAHIVYKITAMCFEKFQTSRFVMNSVISQKRLLS